MNLPAAKFSRILQISLSSACGAVFFLQSVFGAEILSQRLMATITTPNTSAPLENFSAESDPILLPEVETFPVRAIAQPRKKMNLSAWSIIPGTDGNANERTTITNFQGKVLGGKIELSWQPRQLFQENFAKDRIATAGLSCEALKTHCLPTGSETLGAASQTCSEGNIPTNFDCTLPKKYTVFHEILKPDVLPLHTAQSRFALDLPAAISPTALAQQINNTKLLVPECQSGAGCEYEGYPVGWRTALKPMAAEKMPLLRPDGSSIAYETLSVDEANGFIPSLGANAPGNPWARDIIVSGTYSPNVTQNSYSGIYVFSYFNFLRAFNPDVNGDPANPQPYSAQSFFPLKDMAVLVDDFDQYEIYALEDKDYHVAEGVTRENGTLVKVLRDPSLTKTEINIVSSDLDPNTSYHFAIFEVRESGGVKLPKTLTEKIVAKSVNAADCEGGPLSPATCTAVVGHLISTNTELKLSAGTIAPEQAPAKIEWHLAEREGKYSSDPIQSDANGEMRCGVNQDEVCTFPITFLNRLASDHFFAATYGADSTELQTDGNGSFSIRANRIFSDAALTKTLSEKTAHLQNSENLSGTVLNSWTEEIIPGAKIELRGKSTKTQEDVTILQKTSQDGFFSFTLPSGIYTLAAQSIRDTSDTFIFPTAGVSPAGDVNAGTTTCGAIGVFTDLYCRPNIQIALSEGAKMRNVALTPTVRGELQGTSESVKVVIAKNGVQIASTWSLPNGKFSFFLAPGNYTVSEIRNANNKVLKMPNLPVQITPGSPMTPIDLTISLGTDA